MVSGFSLFFERKIKSSREGSYNAGVLSWVAMLAKLERIYWLYQQLKSNRYPSRTGYCRQYEVA